MLVKLAPAVGLWMVAMGFAVGGLAIGRNQDGMGAAEVLMLCGVCILLSAWICQEIRRVNRPADVAFDQGFEMGHDIGWREGFAAAQPATVLTMKGRRDAVDGEAAERPVPSRMA